MCTQHLLNISRALCIPANGLKLIRTVGHTGFRFEFFDLDRTFLLLFLDACLSSRGVLKEDGVRGHFGD